MNDIVLFIISIILVSLVGIFRLYVFGDCSLKKALIVIIVINFIIGLLEVLFYIFSINEKSTQDIILSIIIIPLVIFFAVVDVYNSKKKKHK